MLTIKNISVAPQLVLNDGSGRAKVRCTVFTPNDRASVERVYLDLRHTSMFCDIPLVPDPANLLTVTGDGDYVGDLEVPELMDSGRYRLPIVARDSTGDFGRREGELHVRYFRPPQRPEIASPEFLAQLEKFGFSHFVPGNQVEILENGYQAFEARLMMIEGARSQINLQTYTLGSEIGSRRIVNLLLRKAWKGVEVNILLNGDSQIPTSPLNTLKLKINQYLTQWVKATRQQLETKPLYDTILKQVLSRAGTQSINLFLFRGTEGSKKDSGAVGEEKPPAHWLERMIHDAWSLGKKVNLPSEWVASFTGPGGLPALPLLDYAVHEKILVVDGQEAIVGGRNLEDRYFTYWIDLDVKVRGPVVGQIQKGFLQTFEETAAIQGKHPRIRQVDAPLEPCSQGVSAMFVQSRPWKRQFYNLNALVYSIQASRRRICISSQYITLPDSLLRDAFLEAARRGVEIYVLTNSERTCEEVNFSTGYFVTLSYLEPLLRAGIRVFELKGWEDSSEPQPYYHVKEFIFDGKLVTIGSFNLSLRSCYIESENLLFISDPELAFQREAVFLSRLKEEAREITLEHLAEKKRESKLRLELSRYLALLY